MTKKSKTAWISRGDIDDFTGATREQVENGVSTEHGRIDGRPEVDHILEIQLLQRIIENSAASAVGLEWSEGGYTDEAEAQVLLERLKQGACLSSGRKLRSTTPHHEFMVAVANDLQFENDGWEAGQGNLNVTHMLVNRTKKTVFSSYCKHVLLLDPDWTERHIPDKTVDRIAFVTLWKRTVQSSPSDVSLFLEAAGLNARKFTAAASRCLQKAIESASMRLNGFYKDLDLDASTPAHEVDLDVRDRVLEELALFRTTSQLA